MENKREMGENEVIKDTFSKKDFKKGTTGWFKSENKGILILMKLGELKDDSIYMGFICARMDGVATDEDFKKCLKSMEGISELTSKEIKKRVILVCPVEDWMMTGLPYGWKKSFFDKRKRMIEKQTNYIG